MKPLWVERQEMSARLSVTCSIREPDRQVGAGFRDPVLIHEMMELGLNLEAVK